MHRRIPFWWRESGKSRTKQLYRPEKPVVYIVPIHPPSWEGCFSSQLKTTALFLWL